MRGDMIFTFSSITVILGILFLLHNIKPSLTNQNRNDGGGYHYSPSSQDNLRQPSLAKINIDLMTDISLVSHFWKSTGFCPPDPHQNDSSWFLNTDMEHNLAFIGGIPFGGITDVRVHYLLDTIMVKSFSQPVFDFTTLDQFIALLWNNQVRPIFEVMGNPSNYFTDFENKTQVLTWRSLVLKTVQRYLSLYGSDYVSKWNFETWNEPRSGHFDGLNMTIKGFLNYYDATRDALKSASPKIKFGGPGGECHGYDLTKSYCWNLLHHVVHGTNYITGQRGQGIDFISIHKKGDEPDNTKVIFDKEEEFYKDLQTHLPELMKTPIYNDEGDPLVGWNKDKWWRADVTYAAMVTKVIVEHQNKWLSKKNNTFNLKLFSNDNGFLSYNPNFFTQRTLLARFQMNNTNPPHVQFIKKPVYSVMGLLSYLGEIQLNASVTITSPNHVGVLATYHKGDQLLLQDSNQITVSIYSSVDSHQTLSETNVSVNMVNMNKSKEYLYIVYRLDNYWTNPHGVWLRAGKPKTPDFETFAQMRAKEEPLRVTGPSPVPHSTVFQLNITVTLPGVALIHMCEKAIYPPDQVTNVKLYNITSGQVLIVWSDSCVNTKCIKTYEVEFSHKMDSPQENYHRINTKDTLFNIFVFATNTTDVAVHGSYRIRAVDYWSRPGEYSLPVQYP